LAFDFLHPVFLITNQEVAFIGKAPGTYSMLLGGGYYGQRLNKIYRGTPIFPFFFLGFIS
jgi:hypothetical protein